MAPQGRATNAAAARAARLVVLMLSTSSTAGLHPQRALHPAVLSRRPRVRVLAVASKTRDSVGSSNDGSASCSESLHGDQPGQPDTKEDPTPLAQLERAEAAQEPPEAPVAPAETMPTWLTGRNLAFAGSALTIVLLTVFRKEIAPIVKWVVMQAGSFSDKSSLGQVSAESVATTLVVGLTLWWSYAEFQRSNERLRIMQALEASLEAKQADLAERLEAVEAREAALEARLAALEEQWQRGGGGGGS